MPDQNITITPTLVTNPDGSESVSYDEAQIVSSDGRQRAIAQFNYEQDKYISENSKGERQHAFDFGEVPDDYLYEPPTPSTYGETLPEQDIQYVYDQNGGQENFNEVLAWGRANLPRDIINTFNEVLKTSDMEEILSVTKSLTDFYHENAGQPLLDNPSPQRTAFVEDDYYPSDEEVEEMDEFADSMFALIGGEENYNTLMGWAERTLTTTSIDIFDEIMDSGDYSAKEQAIDMLIKSFRTQGDDD